MNSALPVHEGFAVTADLEGLDELKKLVLEALADEAGCTERTGTTDVMILVGAGS